LIYFHIIKPHTIDKKEKISKHHNNLINILKEWQKIEFVLSKSKQNCPTISIPLYIEVVDKLNSFDIVHYLKSHLSQRYQRVNEYYDELYTLQNNYNIDVMNFIPSIEQNIIKILEDNGVEFIDGENKKMFLSTIFEYYSRKSKGEM
jgi:hypothetical protein